MNNLITILLSVLLGSLGQVILKIGANKLGTLSLAWNSLFYDIFRIVKIPEIIIGLVLFGSSFLLWIKVLTKSDLSYAYPMVSLGYINVIVISYFLFNEQFTLMKVIGVSLIILGVIVLNK
ncbi:SMR family transporter [Ureibacillus aquaedulcis]|uniref:SMR family transporter n=1 Tax=Ureibacillus aquaedulcis TaxID=3058421 RepID=A0ABT8GM78_9BACL|nr:SMR family transporter [Ureibacillus sp. BA0131]MDN4492523.1 SMR family transporter [Ureibacillus sp. BA0131]